MRQVPSPCPSPAVGPDHTHRPAGLGEEPTMSTIGRRIRSTGWTRPDPDLMHRLAGIPVANVDDVMQRI